MRATLRSGQYFPLPAGAPDPPELSCGDWTANILDSECWTAKTRQWPVVSGQLEGPSEKKNGPDLSPVCLSVCLSVCLFVCLFVYSHSSESRGAGSGGALVRVELESGSCESAGNVWRIFASHILRVEKSGLQPHTVQDGSVA